MRFDDGCIASVLSAGTLPSDARIHDPFGFATGALEFELSLEAGGFVNAWSIACRRRYRRRRMDIEAFDWSTRLR